MQWIKQGWLDLWPIRIDYTAAEGRRKTLVQRTTTSLFESLGGRICRLPTPKGSPGLRWSDPRELPITPLGDAAEIRGEILRTWNKYTALKQAAAIQRYQQRLTSWGVPSIARSIQVYTEPVVRLPLFIGLLTGDSGRRCAFR